MKNLFVIFLVFSVGFSVFAADIPSRPEKLKFPELKYEPPKGSDYRVELKSGPVAFVVPNRELPLISISILVRTGKYNEPKGKEGLAAMTGYLLSKGGTKSHSAEALEERLAFLAAGLSSNIGDTSGSVGVNLLSKDLDEGLAILREVLTVPRFQRDRFDLYKTQQIQSMKQRNDDSRNIERRELVRLAYGDHFFRSQSATKASIDSITESDLRDFHRDWFHPGNFVVSVSGDFDRKEMVLKLEKLFSDWSPKGKTAKPVPTNKKFAKAGIYIVDKEVNQGRVDIMLPGIMRDNPDYYAVQVMNDILGGGGFTSRITNRVRSDEGLAYSAYSYCPGGTYFPRTFVAGYQSKSRTVLYAAQIVLEEMRKITQEEVTDKEIETAKASYIQTFPQAFETKGAVASTFSSEEFTGRLSNNPNYFDNFRSKIRAVTKADVQRVAGKYLTPDKVAILIIGDKEEILKGHPDHLVNVDSLTSGGVKDIPMRDPFTLQPLK
jgi:zinc protease